ncbi:MAG: cell division protein FtsZ [Candidatus Nitrosocaldaceae archaeon]|nr:MAG: cell division protein FtsZ [Candidatus Nitrosocaldaceae archaeon]
MPVRSKSLNTLVIGIGQCGSNIADTFAELGFKAIAINTAEGDLRLLSNIPNNRRIVIGRDRFHGGGVGGNPSNGRTAMENDLDKVLDVIEDVNHNIELVIIPYATGGGTGSGGAPVLIERLTEKFSDSLIIPLAVLPLPEDGATTIVNSAYSLSKLVKLNTSCIFLADNDWIRRSDMPIDETYDRINKSMAKYFDDILYLSSKEVVSNKKGDVLDRGDVINLLSAGAYGTFGYAKSKNKEVALEALLDKALSPSGLYADLDIRLANAFGLICRGPSNTLRASTIFNKIREMVLKLENKSAYIRRGVYPNDALQNVEILTIFTGVTRSPRIQEIIRQGKLAYEEIINAKQKRVEEAFLADEFDLDAVYSRKPKAISIKEEIVEELPIVHKIELDTIEVLDKFENRIIIQDRTIGRIGDVYIVKGEYFCELCNSKDCKHIEFVSNTN